MSQTMLQNKTRAASDSNEIVQKHAKAKCAFFAWARFGVRPFQLTELFDFIENNHLWREDTPMNADSMIIISVGELRKGVRSNINRLKRNEKIFVDGDLPGTFQCHAEKMLDYLEAFKFPDTTTWLSNLTRVSHISLTNHKRLLIEGGTRRIIDPTQSEHFAKCAFELLKSQTNQLKLETGHIHSIESKRSDLKRKLLHLADAGTNATERDEAATITDELFDINSTAEGLIATRAHKKNNIETLIQSVETSLQEIKDELQLIL